MQYVAVFALALAACSQSAAPDPAVEDLGDGVYRVHPDEATLADIPDGTPGARLDTTQVRDCAYVQWCNEPGPRGTICRARPECGCSGVVECNEEVNRICGGFTDPAYFLCPGKP